MFIGCSVGCLPILSIKESSMCSPKTSFAVYKVLYSDGPWASIMLWLMLPTGTYWVLASVDY